MKNVSLWTQFVYIKLAGGDSIRSYLLHETILKIFEIHPIEYFPIHLRLIFFRFETIYFPLRPPIYRYIFCSLMYYLHMVNARNRFQISYKIVKIHTARFHAILDDTLIRIHSSRSTDAGSRHNLTDTKSKKFNSYKWPWLDTRPLNSNKMSNSYANIWEEPSSRKTK